MLVTCWFVPLLFMRQIYQEPANQSIRERPSKKRSFPGLSLDGLILLAAPSGDAASRTAKSSRRAIEYWIGPRNPYLSRWVSSKGAFVNRALQDQGGRGFMKTPLRAILVCAVVVSGVLVGSSNAFQKRFALPAPPTKADIERGRYLVEEVAKCPECHTPRKPNGELDEAAWLRGAPIWIQPVARYQTGPTERRPWQASPVLRTRRRRKCWKTAPAQMAKSYVRRCTSTIWLRQMRE